MKTTQSITPQLGPTALHRLAWPAVGAALSVKRCTRAPAPLLHARHSGVPTCPPVSTAVDWAAATPGSVPEVWRGSWCPCEAACCTQPSSKLQMVHSSVAPQSDSECVGRGPLMEWQHLDLEVMLRARCIA